MTFEATRLEGLSARTVLTVGEMQVHGCGCHLDASVLLSGVGICGTFKFMGSDQHGRARSLRENLELWVAESRWCPGALSRWTQYWLRRMR